MAPFQTRNTFCRRPFTKEKLAVLSLDWNVSHTVSWGSIRDILSININAEQLVGLVISSPQVAYSFLADVLA
jgi:hypothetical protein